MYIYIYVSIYIYTHGVRYGTIQNLYLLNSETGSVGNYQHPPPPTTNGDHKALNTGTLGGLGNYTINYHGHQILVRS